MAPIAFEDVDSKGDGFIDLDETKAYMRQATDKTVLNLVYGFSKPEDSSEQVVCATCEAMEIAKNAGQKFTKSRAERVGEKTEHMKTAKLVKAEEKKK